MVEKNQFIFRKNERLSGKTRIEKMFSSGDAFLSYPFRVILHVYDKQCAEVLPTILISIPKRRLKKAVDRNRMKRLTKESYRLNKSLLDFNFGIEGRQIDIAFIYVGNEVKEYSVVEKGVVKALRDINRRMISKEQ